MEVSTVRKHTLVEEVSDRLAEAIRKGRLAVEGLLPSERQLAEQFGVSRPVVREATKRGIEIVPVSALAADPGR